MFSKLCLIAIHILSLANAAPIELCKLQKEWNAEPFPFSDDCQEKNLNLSANKFTIGGYSGGGFMTSNLFTMFNDNIDGAAIMIGSGPCANEGIDMHGDKVLNDWLSCTNRGKKYSTKGIKGKPVFMYAGTKDITIPIEKSKKTANFFGSMGANMTKRWIADFTHIIPNNVQSSDKYNPPVSCAKAVGTGQCGYNMALEAFTHLYGEDGLYKDENPHDSGTLYAVDQRPFNYTGAHLAAQAFLYVPDACLKESCRFHVEFHGCFGSAIVANDVLFRTYGYMEHAAASKIIILAPNTDDQERGYCWRSSMDQLDDHPQIQGIADLIKTILGQDLLREGVNPTKHDSSSAFSSLMTKFGQGFENYQQIFSPWKRDFGKIQKLRDQMNHVQDILLV